MSQPRHLHELAIRNAERDEHRIAVVDGQEAIAYGTLVLHARRIAALMIDAGCRPGDRVALWMRKSSTQIAAMLAASMSGCLYVPMDPASPGERAARILEVCEPTIVWTDGAGLEGLLAALRQVEGPAVGWAGEQPPAGLDPRLTLHRLESVPPAEPSGAIPPEAHILFTSGSTGVPKGVVVEHRSVLAFVRWANQEFGAGPEDRNSGHSPFFFDLSTYDIFGTLASGGELHLVAARQNLMPHRLAAFIRERRLTRWFSVPSALAYMAKLDAVLPGDFPDLRLVLWCGEVLPTPALIHWMQRVPHARYTNLYGPTETTIASSYHHVSSPPRDPRAEIPIGRACAGEELLILDDRQQPVPDGEPGQLHIAGVGLSPGYWRSPTTTASAFVSRSNRDGTKERVYRTGDLARRDADGVFHFLGRSDTQIKSRGFRIELGEIEAALAALEDLRESAVVAIPSSGFEGTAIGCAYVARRGRSLTTSQIRSRLAHHLPTYMLPSRWLACEDALPRTANGKVDRRRIVARLQGDGGEGGDVAGARGH